LLRWKADLFSRLVIEAEELKVYASFKILSSLRI
jgi:hypothetical protein